jgi:antitoxin component YwqK of YwqJK toxin-antitoxin module
MNGGWIKDSLIKNGTTYAYYDSAKTLLREKNEFKNYKLDGVRQYWGRKRITPPGEYEFVEYEPKVYLSQEREFKHGELLTTKFYFLGGQLEAIYTYVEDFVDTERHFYPGGEFHYEIKHKRYGMYDGEYIKYFSDGTVKERSFYKNNHLDSIQTEYFENGNPWKETYHGKSEEKALSGKNNFIEMVILFG